MRFSASKIVRFALCALGLVACFPDLTGLSSSSGDVPQDGALPPGSDGGNLPDAVVDQLAPGDGGEPFCVQGAHAFCDDFESGQLLNSWDAVTADLGGKVEISTARAFGGKHSLFTTLPRRGNVKTYYAATVRRSRQGAWKRAIINMEVWVEPIVWQAGDVNSGVVSVVFDSSAASKGVALSLDKTGTTLAVDGDVLPQGAVFPEGRWVHLLLDIDPTSGVELKLDGVTQAKKTLASPWQPGNTPSVKLELGVNGFNDPAPEYSFYYDNVTVDFP